MTMRDQKSKFWMKFATAIMADPQEAMKNPSAKNRIVLLLSFHKDSFGIK